MADGKGAGAPDRAGRRYHHGDLRRALIGAALDVLGREGLGKLSLREVARRVGVSQAAPYGHFENTAALLAAVAEEGHVALRGRMEAEAREGGEDPLRRLTGAGTAYVGFASEHPAWFRLMFGPGMAGKKEHPDTRAAYRAGYATLVGLVEDAQRASALCPGDPEDLARAFWALMHGLALLTLDQQWQETSRPAPPSAKSLAEEAAALLYDGISARSPDLRGPTGFSDGPQLPPA